MPSFLLYEDIVGIRRKQESSHISVEGQVDSFAIARRSVLTFAGLALWKERNTASWPVCSHPVLIPSLCLEAQVAWLCKCSGLVACVHHMPPMLCQLWHCILHSSMQRLNMMRHHAEIGICVMSA